MIYHIKLIFLTIDGLVMTIESIKNSIKQNNGNLNLEIEFWVFFSSETSTKICKDNLQNFVTFRLRLDLF